MAITENMTKFICGVVDVSTFLTGVVADDVTFIKKLKEKSQQIEFYWYEIFKKN